jgi:hypothetical protein
VPATYPAPFLRIAAVALIATACATVPAARIGSEIQPNSPYTLTAAEISGVHVNSAYEAVQRLKPNFLLGLRGESVRAVYLNGMRLLGGLENLRTIEAAMVQQIVFLNGIDATTRYGSGHGAGVLLVSTMPGQSWEIPVGASR